MFKTEITAETVLRLLHDHAILETEAPITPQDDLFALGLDSLAMMQLMLHLERTFGVAISPTEITRERFSCAAVLAEWLAASSTATAHL